MAQFSISILGFSLKLEFSKTSPNLSAEMPQHPKIPSSRVAVVAPNTIPASPSQTSSLNPLEKFLEDTQASIDETARKFAEIGEPYGLGKWLTFGRK